MFLENQSFSLKTIGWNFLLLIQVMSYGSYAVLVHLCEEKGQISFNSASMNLLIEIFKLLLTIWCYFVDTLHEKLTSTQNKDFKNRNQFEPLKLAKLEKHAQRTNYTISQTHLKGFSLIKSLHFSIPAFLYFINNNLAVYIQLYMDSTSYQMLSNFKILTTAVLYYLIIGKKMNRAKWISLVILFLSGVFYSLGNLKPIRTQQLKSQLHRSILSLFQEVNILWVDQ